MLVTIAVVSVLAILLVLFITCVLSSHEADMPEQVVPIYKYLENLLDDGARFDDGRHLVKNISLVLSLEEDVVIEYLMDHHQWIDLLCTYPYVSAFN